MLEGTKGWHQQRRMIFLGAIAVAAMTGGVGLATAKGRSAGRTIKSSGTIAAAVVTGSEAAAPYASIGTTQAGAVADKKLGPGAYVEPTRQTQDSLNRYNEGAGTPVIYLAQGLIRGRDLIQGGTCGADPNCSFVYRFRHTITVTGGTGIYNHATGTITVQEQHDTRTGRSAMTYVAAVHVRH